MNMPRRKWLWLVLTLLAVGLGLLLFFVFHHTTNLSITRQSAGGFSGRGDGHNFTITAADLTSEQLKEVETKIERAKFFSLKANYPATLCADAYTTSLDIRLNNQAKKVIFTNCGQQGLPSQLLDLDKYLQTLAKS